jgi:hypothetical protein
MALTAPRQASGSLKTDDRKDERRSERRALSGDMIRFVLLHFAGLDASALHDYTFKRHKTDFPNAKADLDIFDGMGRLVFQGREFDSGMAGYWRPLRVTTAPEWASNEQAWGRPSTGRVVTA